VCVCKISHGKIISSNLTR